MWRSLLPLPLFFASSSIALAGPATLYDDGTLFVDYDVAEPVDCEGAGEAVIALSGVAPELDIVIALDASGSVGNAGWAASVGAVNNLLNVLNVAPGGDNVSIVQFSTTSTLRYSFSDVQDPLTIQSVVNGLPYTGGFTRTDDAITDAITEFNTNGRPDAGRVLFILTDGQPLTNTGPIDVCPLRPSLDGNGIVTLIVGVGSGFDPTPVNCLVNSPADIKEVSNFGDLDLTALPSRFPVVSNAVLNLGFGAGIIPGAYSADAGSLGLVGNVLTWTVPVVSSETQLLTVPFVHDSTTAPTGGDVVVFGSNDLSFNDFDGTPVGPISLADATVEIISCDTDGDTIPDDEDDCPLDDASACDLDLDGCIDDADGDGVSDCEDVCVGDDATGDDDADGICNDLDLCFGDDSTGDSDGDFICDDLDVCLGDDATGDSDTDGICDDLDQCLGDDATGDSDGDGVCDDLDQCLGNDSFGDSDGDGICDDLDVCVGDDATGDSDGDGVCDDLDQCLGDDSAGDSDGDGICDDLDQCLGDDATGDSDGDGVCDDLDQCLGDDATGDSDADGICDDIDLCVGDDAAGDSDADGVCDDLDQCLGNDSFGDSDGDGICDDLDVCVGEDASGDSDSDGICDDIDACPLDDANDADGDGVCGDIDVCPGSGSPEAVPSSGDLKPNHYANTDTDPDFEQGASRGNRGNGASGQDYTMADTGGCSCEQILDALPGNRNGEYKFGCSPGTMQNWADGLD